MLLDKDSEEYIILKLYDCSPDKDILNNVPSDQIQEFLDVFKENAISRISREIAADLRIPILPNILLTTNYEEISLDNKNIVYYFEEYVQGVRLDKSSFYKDRQSIDSIVEFLIQMIDIIIVFHEYGFVHRDIKPANIVCNGDNIFIIDPGLGKSHDDRTLTVANGNLGTPLYWAPEQNNVQAGMNWDYKTDLFPIGLIVTEMWNPKFRNRMFNPIQEKDLLNALQQSWISMIPSSEKDDIEKIKKFFRDIIIQLSSPEIFRRSSDLYKLRSQILKYKGV